MPTPLRTLMIEDSEDDAALLLLELEQGGFQPTYDRVDTPEAMAAALERQAWDVILSDYMMPRFNALAALSILREKKHDIPFIIVSGKIGEETATHAMRAGANDYLMKDNLTRLSETVRREMREAANRRALRQAEISLRKSEEKYREFFEADLSADFISTPEGKILICNPSFTRLFGFTSATDAVSHDLKLLSQNLPAWDHLIEMLRQKRTLQWHEIHMRRRDGGPLDVIANLVGRLDSQGELVDFKGYLFDNTERKTLERQIFQSQKMESLGRLASGIAHDFNNVLTGILGYTDLSLKKIDESHSLYPYLDSIRQLVARAARITRQLLTFSKRQALEPARLNLNTVLSDLLPLLGKMLGGQVEAIFVPDSTLRNVHADLAQMEQVVLNLCVNARDAMPKGGKITLTARNLSLTAESGSQEVPSLPPGEYVLLTVSDTGSGMDEKTLERIFEPFFSTKGPDHGTGLGLSIVHGIVGQHGGTVAVESQVGKGSTFKIFLPAGEKSERSASSQKPVVGNVQRRSEKILVVEDEPLLREVFRQALEAQGHAVLLAENGEEGLRQVERDAESISLILSDIVMPKMNGRDFYLQVQKIRPEMKFLFVSGFINGTAYEDWISEKRLPLLLKPFSPAELVNKVRELLEPPSAEIGRLAA